MTFQMGCPHCKKTLNITGYRESFGGKVVTCGYCKKSLKLPFVAQLPPDYREELQREQDKLRKKAWAAGEKRIRAQQKARYRRQVEIELEQQFERIENEEQLRQQAEAAQQQQYAKALSDARAEADKPKIWHCSIGEKQFGPMQESMVQVWVTDGKIGEDDYVRVEGTGTWIRLSDIPERFHVPAQVLTTERTSAKGAPTGNAGDAMDSVTCPKCRSAQVTVQKKGFGGGSACCGALLVGPLGLLCGLQGANKVIVTCLKCGHQWSRG